MKWSSDYCWRDWPSVVSVLYDLNRDCEHWNWLQALPNLFLSVLDCSLVSQKRCPEYHEVVGQKRKFLVAVVLIFKLVPPVLLFPLTTSTYPVDDILTFRDTMSLACIALGSWSCLEQRISSLKIDSKALVFKPSLGERHVFQIRVCCSVLREKDLRYVTACRQMLTNQPGCWGLEKKITHYVRSH